MSRLFSRFNSALPSQINRMPLNDKLNNNKHWLRYHTRLITITVYLNLIRRSIPIYFICNFLSRFRLLGTSNDNWWEIKDLYHHHRKGKEKKKLLLTTFKFLDSITILVAWTSLAKRGFKKRFWKCLSELWYIHK